MTTLAQHRERLVVLQDAEQTKTFAQYDDVRYGIISRTIDACDALSYARQTPERKDTKGRNYLQLAENRWTRFMRLLGEPHALP